MSVPVWRRKIFSIGWGPLFDGRDCVAGYAAREARVANKSVKSSDGMDSGIVGKLGAEGPAETYKSNKWIGRLGL